MAFIKDFEQELPIVFSPELKQACGDYRYYVEHILKPASHDLEIKVRANTVAVHEAYGANLICAHSVDYLLAVRKAGGIPGGRKDFIVKFDENFAVSGAYIRNRKMQLIDAINNGLKHIQLHPDRYKDVLTQYGQISARSLAPHDGRVFCHLSEYRFDYCRVVLLPGLKALSRWTLDSDEDVLDFAKGDDLVIDDYDHYDASDPSTAIDRMIELCNSVCANCEELPDDCECAHYVFAGDHGKYEPLHAFSPGEMDELMTLISPSFSKS